MSKLVLKLKRKQIHIRNSTKKKKKKLRASRLILEQSLINFIDLMWTSI